MKNINLDSLNVYKAAKVLRKKVYELVATFPKDEKYRLADQLIRSTRKCPANIAEGYGRFHYQENIQYFRIARGSLTETLDHLSCAEECKYIDQKTYTAISTETLTLIKMINGYIKYLQSQKDEKR